MKIISLLLFFSILIENVFAQNTDPLSYHSSRQLTDSSYSVKKPNGDSTIFLFSGEGGETGGGISTLTTTGNGGRATLIGNTLNVPVIPASITLTTTGSGPATFTAGTLNIPPTPAPIATTITAGIMKVGANLSIDGNGILSAATGPQSLKDVTNKNSRTTDIIGAPGITLYNVPTYLNQDSAYKNGLRHGDVYKSPSRQLMIVDTAYSGFNFTIDNTKGLAANVSFKLNNWGSPNFTIKVDWGDGAYDNFSGNYTYQLTHTYTAKRVFPVVLTFDNASNVKEFSSKYPEGANNNLLAINNITSLPTLYSLVLFKVRFSFDSLMNFTSLPPGLKRLYITGSGQTTFDPPVALPALTELGLAQNNLTSFAPVIPLPATLTGLELDNNNWTSAQVNSVLHYLTTQTFNAGVKEVYLRQEIPAPATGQGLIDKATLETRGWIVHVDEIHIDNNPAFNLTIDNTTGTATPQFQVNAFGAPYFKMKIDWGDGAIDSTTYQGAYSYQPGHTYLSSGIFNVKLFFDNNNLPREFQTLSVLGNNNIVAFKNLKLTNFYQLNLLNNKITSLDSIGQIPSTLRRLSLQANQLTVFDPAVALPPLVELNLRGNQLTSFAPTLPLPATIDDLDLSYNAGWTSTQVNNALIYLAGQTFNTGDKTLDIRQDIPSPPSGAGLTAMNNLIANGWIITHD